MRGNYIARERALARARTRAATARRAAPTASRASCSRPPTSCSAGPGVDALVRASSSTRSSRTSRRSTCPTRAAKNLTPYDVLMIASMVEREAALAARAPLIAAVIYNRLQAGHAARDRRDDPLRDRQLDPPADADAELRSDSRLQHAHPRGAAARRRSATRAWPRSRRRPARRSVDYLYYVVKPGDLRRSTPSRRPTRSSSATSPKYNAARAKQPAASRPTEVLSRDDAAALGVLGWPVGHSRSPAMHNAAFAALGLRLELRSSCRWRPSCSTETVRALPGVGFVGANVTIPHKLAALELADAAQRTAAARSARPTR